MGLPLATIVEAHFGVKICIKLFPAKNVSLSERLGTQVYEVYY